MNILSQASFFVAIPQKRSKLHEIMEPCQHDPKEEKNCVKETFFVFQL
jgi:hypothetical protein